MTERRLLCTRCRQLLPVSAFPRDPKLRLGFSSWCVDCKRAATRAWRARVRVAYNAARRAAYVRVLDQDREKTCSRCHGPFTAPAGQKRSTCDDCKATARREGDARAWQRRKLRLAETSRGEAA